MAVKTELATLAGGCFWCLETAFSRLNGVSNVVSGYAGGKTVNPTYEQVTYGTTGHAETIQTTFDAAVISYRELLEVFFAIHDPTTLNRQGADVGTQYRSVIFYHTPKQKTEAEQMIKELDNSQTWDKPTVTEVKPLTMFYPAEEYHQHYYEKHPAQSYCKVVINPKLAKLRQKFAAKLRE
jgi:peptide-methionine (S)-S-oxide reductase